MAGTNLPKDGPVDVRRLAAFRGELILQGVMTSEFEIIVSRGVSFPHVAQTIYAHIFWSALAAFLFALSILSLSKSGDLLTAFAVMAVSLLAFLWVWFDWTRRHDHVVLNDSGIALWRGRIRVLTIGWEALAEVRRLFPGGPVRISSQNGPVIWLTSSVEGREALFDILAWARSCGADAGSLRKIVDAAFDRGIVFRYSSAVALQALASALAGVAFGVGAFLLPFPDESVILILVKVSMIATPLALSLVSFASVLAFVRRRGDTLVLRRDGIENRALSGVTFIAWADTATPEAIRRRYPRPAGTFYVCDSSGRKEIDDKGLLEFRTVAGMLASFHLSREIQANDGLVQIRALDALRLA